MKLQEIAFMVGLIKANYNRRMLYFWGNVVVLVIASVVIYYEARIDPKDHNSYIFIWSIFWTAALLRAFIVYSLKGDDELRLPWNIKKAQMTSLRQHAKAKGDFEDLQCHVPLHEYFEMY